MAQPVKQTDFSDLKLVNRGKVRDIYDLGDSLLMVTSDRISAFDVIMNEPIPDKGKVLTKISE
ncbi:MAG: phosphoribosylaminoimidazolesuccinocarboxamide synthase, partial [Trichlorobacter sp.]|nr:phosphoribosylaminoimidazolesuccinocarboxamide synthase [Trichlorobacter sp.]